MTRLSALALVAFAATAQAQSPADLDHASLTRELRTLVGGSPSAKMTSLGTTIGGRDIWVVEIANPGGTPVAERPGVLVVGNLEGDHLVACTGVDSLSDATKGEVGGYKLYWEGIDSDDDGFLNEDGPGGVDLSNNFQHDYPYFDADAGPHMGGADVARASHFR